MIPHGSRLAWRTFAGGIGAREGAHGYAAVSPVGEYYINAPPHRRRGYHLWFVNSRGFLGGVGLWTDLGTYRTPQNAKAAAQRFDHVLIRAASPASRIMGGG
jgi:hypothetical protein